jgi:SAM-dependent methyltransferase
MEICERMCGLEFQLSVGAFFQVNTAAAATLYHLAGDWAACGGRTLLFDVCCGTGTIGLTLARRVGKVVGVDIVEAAIRDATANAARLGVKNAEFVCGKAEVVLPGLLRAYAEKVGDASQGDDGEERCETLHCGFDNPSRVSTTRFQPSAPHLALITKGPTAAGCVTIFL